MALSMAYGLANDALASSGSVALSAMCDICGEMTCINGGKYDAHPYILRVTSATVLSTNDVISQLVMKATRKAAGQRARNQPASYRNSNGVANK